MRRLGSLAAGALACLTALAQDSLAVPVFEQRLDGVATAGVTSIVDFGQSAYAPFHLSAGGRGVEQILWWGQPLSWGRPPPWESPPPTEFTIRFHEAATVDDGGLLPDLDSFIEISVLADSISAGAATQLFWTDLSSPVILPAGVGYLSIVANDFRWQGMSGAGAEGSAFYQRYIGFDVGLLLIRAEMRPAFVLNDTIEPIPEPSSALLLGLGLGALGWSGMRPR